MASVIATRGLLVIPARRRKAKREMQMKVSELRQRLGAALRIEFERAQEQSGTRIAHAVDPFSRFVSRRTSSLAGGAHSVLSPP